MARERQFPSPYICINCFAAGGYATQKDLTTARHLHNNCVNNELTQIACVCSHVVESK